MATTETPQDIVQRLLVDRPNLHLGGAAHWASLPETLEEIRASVKPGDVTIETGVGASTVVFAVAGAHHTAISPDGREHELVREYCRRIGVDDSRLTFIADFSENVLPGLLSRDRTLDAAFIDGAHCFPFAAVDWCYITRALKVGGRLIMDDVSIPSVEQVFRHMTLEPNWRLERVLDHRAASFTLLGPPSAEDDWQAQRINARYPDLSFEPPVERLRLLAAYRAKRLRQDLIRRNPALAKTYKGVRSSISRLSGR